MGRRGEKKEEKKVNGIEKQDKTETLPKHEKIQLNLEKKVNHALKGEGNS